MGQKRVFITDWLAKHAPPPALPEDVHHPGPDVLFSGPTIPRGAPTGDGPAGGFPPSRAPQPVFVGDESPRRVNAAAHAHSPLSAQRPSRAPPLACASDSASRPASAPIHGPASAPALALPCAASSAAASAPYSTRSSAGVNAPASTLSSNFSSAPSSASSSARHSAGPPPIMTLSPDLSCRNSAGTPTRSSAVAPPGGLRPPQVYCHLPSGLSQIEFDLAVEIASYQAESGAAEASAAAAIPTQVRHGAILPSSPNILPTPVPLDLAIEVASTIP